MDKTPPKKREIVKRAKITAEQFRHWRVEQMKWKQWQAANLFEIQLRTYQGWEKGARQFHADGKIWDLMERERRKKERQDKARADNATEDMFD